jgi:D-alanyl-D-alanine carboxypeptidase (penicillin-binding protein 5/6)
MYDEEALYLIRIMNIRQNTYRVNSAAKRSRLRRKKQYFVIGLLVIIGSVGVFDYVNNDDEVNKVASVSIEPSINNEKEDRAKQELLEKIAASPLATFELPITAQSAVGTLELGTIITTENEQQVPIASITKVITSLVILDKQPLQIGEQGKDIVLTAQDEKYYWDYVALQGTITPITAGFSMTTHEVLQAMLLASSNNMADTLVDNYFATQQDYLDYANEYLQRNGLENTQVADTTGFSPDSKSTPSDMIKLAQLALNNPVVKEIVAQTEGNIAVAGTIPNYNPLINDPDVIGLKPGATDEAGYTLLFAAELPTSGGKTETFIGVTLGFNDRQEYIQTARNMIESARSALLQQLSL